MPRPDRFTGKVAFVTGAASGIGRAAVCAWRTHVDRKLRSWLMLRWWQAANCGEATSPPDWPCA